jgi:aspartyl/asparaginyl beta-hydroxylase (cupin superfamily)
VGDMEGALAAVERALAISPLDFSSLLARAMLLDRIGDPQAGEAFSRAVAQIPSNAEVPEAMVPAVEQAKARAQAYRDQVQDRLTAVIPAGLGEGERRQLERFASNTARRTRHFHQEPTDFHFPGLPEIEFHDTGLFEGIAELNLASDDIRAEYGELLKLKTAKLEPYSQYPDHVPLEQWRELNNNPAWTAVHLFQNGRRVEANAAHCPKTLAALSRLPQPAIPNASPNAMFSLLAARTRIPPHTGVANVRLVAHLPLIVPPGCGFRVGGTTIKWKVGHTIIFDDTIEHEAWNDSDELRVVLIFDLWAPALKQWARDGAARIIAAAGVSFNGA